MDGCITTGTWIVDEEHGDAFSDAWSAFAAWTTELPGAGTLRLGRDAVDRRRYVSFGNWSSADEVRAWKSAPEFRERLAHVLQHVEDFHSTELDVVAERSHPDHATVGSNE